MADNKKKSKKGVPLFDKATLDKIIKEALASENAAEVARKYNTTPFNVYRWVRLHKKRLEKNGHSNIPSDVYQPNMSQTAGGQYRRQPQGESDEVRRLKQENRELLEVIGRLTIEKEKLRQR